MPDIEKKLADYRAKKNMKKSEETSNYKTNLLQIFSRERAADTKDLKEKLIEDIEFEELPPSPPESDIDETANCCSYMDIVYYTLCFMLWATIWAIFIKLQFGLVYFVTSALIGIYLNTRTGPKKRGEISAYSVFNKDCESIDGTLKAEQFEREIRYGPGSLQ